MSLYLSKTEISSFCGDVLPLQLLGREDLREGEIRWTASSSILSLQTFRGNEPENFNNGVLLTLKKEGTATVTAEFEGKTYECTVNIREARKAKKGDTLLFFAGDFHDHTSEIHNRPKFAARESGFPIDYLKKQKEDGRLAFAVISDHATITNPRDFFRGFTDLELVQPMSTVIFPGSESEVTFIEHDRFGLSHKNSGEIVCVNANNFCFSRTWEPFWEAFSDAPFAVCVFAHPQVVGWDGNGIWNFQLHKNNTPLMKQLIKGVEVGQGNEGCMLYEHTYSVALDNGFKVAPVSPSDCHGPNWGYDAWPGKTVALAPDGSREMILDALLNRRFYATESGNVKLRYTVNGCIEGETLPATNRYDFHVDLDFFREDPTTVPVMLKVISDYGTVVAEYRDFERSFDFTVRSDTARYFYLRFTDEEGRKTWSAPVWTGRATDDTAEPELTALDKTDFTATELLSGKDAANVINNDPMTVWEGDLPTAEILIDMKKSAEICAVGHYPARYLMAYFQQTGADFAATFARYAHGYEVELSDDGNEFHPVAKGLLRVFGGEEYITFPKQTARFVKFRVTSTIGKASDLERHAEAKVSISELTVFTDKN